MYSLFLPAAPKKTRKFTTMQVYWKDIKSAARALERKLDKCCTIVDLIKQKEVETVGTAAE